MKVLVLGCGEMGQSAILDLYHYGEFDTIIVGARNAEKASLLQNKCVRRKTKTRFINLDVKNVNELEEAMKLVDVVVNCVGPNYKYEVLIAQAAIRTRKDLVDINDDFETTYQMFELDKEARDQDISIIIGMGASPGVNNILVRAAADQLDTVDKIHTSWVMSGADPGGLALSYHLLYSLSNKALTYQNGKIIEVKSFIDGKEKIKFPDPIGEMDVYHVGHPEPITLSRYFKNASYVDDKATFNPPAINDLILNLGKIARSTTKPIMIKSKAINAMDFAASYLHQYCKQLKNIPKEGALHVKVEGEKGGTKKNVFFSSSARIAHGTGIPASIGAIMLKRGEIVKKGINPPENCINPHDFIYEIINRRKVAKLNGWIE
jgi:saccharopine dehydrogenase-like NADP-dependent oxidoreductase